MFKVGDKVKLNGCPYDEQIVAELIIYTFMKDQVQAVIETKRVSEEGTSGQWIKTDHMADWTDSAWFTEVK